MRAGLLEVVSQAARITAHTDHRLEHIFGKLPKFRAASFRPAENTGPPSKNEERLPSGSTASRANGWASTSGRWPSGAERRLDRSASHVPRLASTLRGAGLEVPEQLDVMHELLGCVTGIDDEVVAETMHQRATDLADGRDAVLVLAELVEAEMPALRAAAAAQKAGAASGDEAAAAEADELGELLARARYSEDLAKIKSSTTAIETAIAASQKALNGGATDRS